MNKARYKDDPLSTHTSNNGFEDRWTCPACYEDLPFKSEGTHVCPSCGSSVRCSVEHEPVSRAELA